ncbi:MAG TPA: response regulator transcription factor [Roseiflexaceae bacterium]|nr:response regulator transcription factor [Roseiflexaceae bacterium]
MNEPIRLLLVDDHSIVRQGLRSILDLEQGISVVGEADNPQAALEAVATLQPDIVLLDLSLGTHGTTAGLEICRAIRAGYPQTNVIVLTTFLEEQLVVQAIRYGAKGYVLKDVDAVDLIKSVRAVSRGESALDTRSATLVMNNLSSAPDTRTPPASLTERELEVIRLLAQGHSNRAIGEQIAISESTVKFHVRNIMRKLGANHRTEIVYTAGKLGLV